MKVRKYRAPPCDVVFIGPHTLVCTISKSCETLVALSFKNDVLWCLPLTHPSQMWCNDTSFKFMPSTMASNSLRLAMLRWSSLSCQSIALSSKEFAMCAMSLHTLTLKRYKFLSLRACATTTLQASLTLQPSLSNSTLKLSKMSLLTKMKLFFIFGTWRTCDGCVCQLASHLHCGFDSPLANGLQNDVIDHEHPPWGNAFVHSCSNVMCYIAPELTIQSYVVWLLAFNASTNICSWSS